MLCLMPFSSTTNVGQIYIDVACTFIIFDNPIEYITKFASVDPRVFVVEVPEVLGLVRRNSDNCYNSYHTTNNFIFTNMYKVIAVTTKSKIHEFNDYWFKILKSEAKTKVVKVVSGEYHYDSENRLHRSSNKPALITANGDMYWYKHGQIHRSSNKPATITRLEKAWFYNGKRHRDPRSVIIDGEECKQCLPVIMYSNGDLYFNEQTTYDLRFLFPGSKVKGIIICDKKIIVIFINGRRVISIDK